jgi:hypothetical protein
MHIYAEIRMNYYGGEKYTFMALSVYDMVIFLIYNIYWEDNHYDYFRGLGYDKTFA